MSVKESKEVAVRIRRAIESSPLTMSEVARIIGTTRQAVHQWATTGRITKRRLMEVAELLGQSYDYFLGVEDMTSREKEEWLIVTAYRQLSREQKKQIKRKLEDLLDLDLAEVRKAPAGRKRE